MVDDVKAPRRPTVLVILDGFGCNPSKTHNAVHEAETPRLDDYFARFPHALIEASGRAVGLPIGQMGNSEVGHLTLGCGSIVRQDLVRIDDAIEDGSFFENEALVAAARSAQTAGRPLHLIGLVSDGGVHSHLTHLLALIRLSAPHGAQPMVHMITDGRDTPPQSATSFLPPLEAALAEAGGCLASVCGRYYAMDRDKRWDRTKMAFDALVRGEARQADTPEQAIRSAYEAGENDEFIKPVRLACAEPIQSGDQVLFFNFRNDRPRQLTAALALEDFDDFDRGAFEPVTVTCLTEYSPDFRQPVGFPPERPATCLADVVSRAGLRQFHCAETEKYAHVTFFLNGGREQPFSGEDRSMVPSPKVATYDLQPEMSAKSVADEVIKAIESHAYALIVVNFANGDMVGHTAVPEAVIRAVETLDREVGRVLDAAVANNHSVLLTADHGNCDEYVDPITGQPHTQHTVYPVPCLLIDESPWRLMTGGGLSNIAPTLLRLIGLEQPPAMEARSLLLEVLPG